MNVTRRWLPLVVTTAALALAAVGNAQDHHDGGGDHGDKSRSSHSDRPSRSRADHDRQSRDSGSRSNDPRSRDSDSHSRDSDPRSRTDSRSSTDRSAGGDRYNPFDRNGSRGTENTRGLPSRDAGPAPANRGRATLGVPIHDQRPSAYDGRGYAPAEHFGHAPVHASLSVAIASGGRFGGTDVAVGARIGGLRVGFVSYSDPGPRAYYGGPRPYGPGPYGFGYPYYAYDPYARGAVVVASPWYGYSFLPPYLDRSRVVIVDSYPAWRWDDWRVYDVDRPRGNPAVRDALDDLRDAFEEGSSRMADRLVPEEGDVAIFNDGKYDYSLNPDDFQKMFLDGVEQSKTVRYDILEARTRGDEVRIRARHTYTDSWGEEQSVVHRITLRRENGGDYVIREFGTE